MLWVCANIGTTDRDGMSDSVSVGVGAGVGVGAVSTEGLGKARC